MLNSLQAGRALAALMVLVHHAVVSTDAFVGQVPPPVYATLNFGYLGVDFFFVLSGFIIYYTTASRPIDGAARAVFAKGRLLRIMIPYLPVGVGMAALYLVFPGVSGSSRDWSWLSTVTLFPTELPPALGVAWTLQHELIFYGLYAVLFFSGRLWSGVAVWMVAIVASQLTSLGLPPLLAIALAPINLEFIFGIVAAWMFLTGRVPPISAAFAVGGLSLSLWITLGAEREQSYLVGLAIAALIPVMCRCEVAGKITVPRVFVFLGAASYAIYLVHSPVLSVVTRAVAAVGVSGWLPGLAVSAAVATAAGILYYSAIERPAMRVIRNSRHRTEQALAEGQHLPAMAFNRDGSGVRADTPISS